MVSRGSSAETDTALQLPTLLSVISTKALVGWLRNCVHAPNKQVHNWRQTLSASICPS